MSETFFLNKEQAIAKMKDGFKITHKYFTPTEWIEMRNGLIRFEDGNCCTLEEFFKHRASDIWKDGYSIYTKLQYEKH